MVMSQKPGSFASSSRFADEDPTKMAFSFFTRPLLPAPLRTYTAAGTIAAPDASAEAADDQVPGDGDPIDEPADRRMAQAFRHETGDDEQGEHDPLDDLHSAARPLGSGPVPMSPGSRRRISSMTRRAEGLTITSSHMRRVGTVSLPPVTERTNAAPSGSSQMLISSTWTRAR
jgi:hypothetical protein